MKRKLQQVKIYHEDWLWLKEQKGSVGYVIHSLLTSNKVVIVNLTKETVENYMESVVFPYVQKKIEDIELKLLDK